MASSRLRVSLIWIAMIIDANVKIMLRDSSGRRQTIKQLAIAKALRVSELPMTRPERQPLERSIGGLVGSTRRQTVSLLIDVPLVQLGVLRLGLLEYRDIGVGVFPED